MLRRLDTNKIQIIHEAIASFFSDIEFDFDKTNYDLERSYRDSGEDLTLLKNHILQPYCFYRKLFEFLNSFLEIYLVISQETTELI